jgi:D-3-phosphoglycerate dehydrogenase
MKIAITTSSFAVHSQEPLDLLRSAGMDIVLNPHGRVLTAAETVDLLSGCAGVVAGTEPLNREVLEALPELRVISRVGVGLDNVDKAYCMQHPIAVRSTPDGPTRAVAELTVAVILDLLRNVSRMDRDLRQGVWKKRMGRLLQGKRVGLVGMGRIGSATAGVLAALGAEISYADPCPAQSSCCQLALEELLDWADIVSLHCSKPGCAGPLLGEVELARMRPGALLVNLARGGLVDEDALARALVEGRLGGAALDVFISEPYRGPLAGIDNVVLTPHVGSYAVEGRVGMETEAVRNLLEALGSAS